MRDIRRMKNRKLVMAIDKAKHIAKRVETENINTGFCFNPVNFAERALSYCKNKFETVCMLSVLHNGDFMLNCFGEVERFQLPPHKECMSCMSFMYDSVKEKPDLSSVYIYGFRYEHGTTEDYCYSIG